MNRERRTRKREIARARARFVESETRRTVDALALQSRRRTRDGCEKPRGGAYHPESRGCPNGETRCARAHHPARGGAGGNRNILVPPAQKSREIPGVAASERGRAQTRRPQWSVGRWSGGVERPVGRGRPVPHRVSKCAPSRRTLGGAARDGESPVDGRGAPRGQAREYHRARETRWEAGATTLQG